MATVTADPAWPYGPAPLSDAYTLAIRQAKLDVICAKYTRGPAGEHLTPTQIKAEVELAQERLNAIIDAVNIGRGHL
jgi:hypothetical protein